MFLPLLETVKLLGLENKINCASNKTLAESLDACVREDDPYFYFVALASDEMHVHCEILFDRVFSEKRALSLRLSFSFIHALYESDSSIRRRDCPSFTLCEFGIDFHRRGFDLKRWEKVAIDNTNLFTKEIAETCNARHLAGQQAGRASAELHTLKFFKDRTTVAEARVFQIRGNNNNKTTTSTSTTTTTTTTTTNNNNNANNIKKGEKDEDEDEIVAFVPKYGIEARVKVSKGFNARQNMFGKLKVKIEVEQMPFGRSKLNVSIVE